MRGVDYNHQAMRKQGIFPAGLNRGKIIKKSRAFWRYINKNDELYIFWATLTYFFVSTANLNNKTIFVSLLGLWVIYNLRLKNIRQSLLLTALTSLMFLVGKTWTVELISPLLMRSADLPQGYLAFIVVTPFQIFASLVFALLIRDIIFRQNDLRVKIKSLFSRPFTIFLCLFFFWQIVSALMADNRFELPLIFSLQSVSFLLIFLGVLAYFPLRHSSASKILSLFGAMSIFQAVLAGMQWLRRSTLGLAIEPTHEMLTYLQGPGQGYFSVRSVGTFSHPNELAIYSASMTLLFLSLLYDKSLQLKLGRKYYLVCFIAAGVSLILSLGRSAWVSYILCLIIFLFVVEKMWNEHAIKLNRGIRKKVVYLIVLVLIFSPMIISRSVESVNLFKPTGGGETRLKLVNESIHLLKQKPFFGSGMGLSGYAMFKYNPKGIISTFPSVVHNLYLLIANESGLPALAAFLLFIAFILRETIRSLNGMNRGRKIMVLGSLMALIVFLVNGMANQVFLMGIFLIITSVLLLTIDLQSVIQSER